MSVVPALGSARGWLVGGIPGRHVVVAGSECLCAGVVCVCRVRVSRGAASRAGRVGQLSRGGRVAWTLVVVAGGGVGVRVGGAGIMAFVLRKCEFCVYVLCLLYAYNIVLCCVCSTVL